MKQISPIITPFRWYDEFYQQDRYKNDCEACEFKLITDRRHLLPFQFKRLPSGYGIDKWLMREVCVEPQNKLLTQRDSLFSYDNAWQNNGGFAFDCGNACSGTSVDADELAYTGALTIGKTYTVSLLVNDFQVTTSGIFYKFYNGATFIQNINTAGLHLITFVATSADFLFQFNAPNPIGADYICITEVQITQAFQQEATDIELDITKLSLANAGSYDYIIYCGQYFTTTMPVGDYYCIITDLAGNTFFSEVFTIRDFFHEKPPYYVLSWKNTCSIGDAIYDFADCTYLNQLYLDEAVISKPDYPYKEEGEENGEQTFIPTFKKWEKKIHFLVAKCPEYITDSLSAITLHDTIYITEPVRKKQELTDGYFQVKSVEVDIQPIMNDCFSNVDINLLLIDKYVDSTCCIDSGIEECAECDYEAPIYYNMLDTISPNVPGVAEYAMINDSGVGAVGLYIWNEQTDAWDLMTIAEDTTCCAIAEPYIWSGGQWHALITIDTAIYAGGAYHVSGWAWPNSYVQIETSPDGVVWTPRTPIETSAVFNLVGITIVNGETPLFFRARNYTLNCEYGYSQIYNWTPELLTKIVAWYKSDVGVVSAGFSVSEWQDQSGGGNHLVQASDVKKPRVFANQLNGYPAIIFDGVNDLLQAAWIQAQPISVFMVFKNIDDEAGAFVFDGAGVADTGGLWLSGSGAEVQRNNAIFGTTRFFWAGAFGVVTCILNGATSYFRTPIQQASGITIGTLAPNGITLGANGDETNFWANIAVVEVIIADVASSVDDRKLVRDYLKAKYLI